MKSCWYPAIVAVAIALGSSAALAQPWPSKPIRAFIPFAAGSATDIVPRALFEPLGVELVQSIIVENRGGAGGTLGMGAVVRADPDGYTILANSSAHTIAPWIVPNFPFDLTKDLSSALMIGQNANILIVSPSKGWKTVQDLVAVAKAKPGSINYGSAGVGTATHIAAENSALPLASKRSTSPTRAAPRRSPTLLRAGSISITARFRQRSPSSRTNACLRSPPARRRGRLSYPTSRPRSMPVTRTPT